MTTDHHPASTGHTETPPTERLGVELDPSDASVGEPSPANPPAADPLTVSGSRPRPRLHFTAERGWINDPYGLHWDGERYHLYYQAVPDQVVWGPNCHWGHATSLNLVGWAEEPLALVPQAFEVGCWSGSVVAEASPPTMFYTRVTGEDFELGQAARAFPTPDGSWTSAPGDVVVTGPPEGLGVRCFRDPNVFRHGEGWVMLMATALEDDVAAVLQYRSADLETWSYDGIVCSRPSSEREGAWTGSLWECPQLLQVDGEWVLLVSVWQDSTLHYVAAAIGDYDGHRFTPRSWQQLTYGNSAYAMAAFRDRDGRPSTLSWLREEPQNNPLLAERASAHSLPALLGVDERGVTLRPHPDIDALTGPVLPAGDPGPGDPEEGRIFPVASEPVLIELPADRSTVHVEEPEARRLSLDVEADGSLTVTRPGFTVEQLPGPGPFAVYLDADIVEIFGQRAYGAYRIRPATSPAETQVSVPGQEAVLIRKVRQPHTP